MTTVRATAEAVNRLESDYRHDFDAAPDVAAAYADAYRRAIEEIPSMGDTVCREAWKAQKAVELAYCGVPTGPIEPALTITSTKVPGFWDLFERGAVTCDEDYERLEKAGLLKEETRVVEIPECPTVEFCSEEELAAARGRRDALDIAADEWERMAVADLPDEEIDASFERWAKSVLAGDQDAEPLVPSRYLDASVRVVESPAPEPRDDPPPAPRDDPDPGTLPVELLRCPGFISETMDYTLATAPYPNQALAFCGALALQSLLAARKVQVGGLRSNVYIVALAFSGAGKDSPRATNLAIAKQAGFLGLVRGKFASGQGIEDALEVCPALLFQVDEVDGLFRAIKDERDPAANSIVGTLLELVGAAQTGLCRRAKAGETQPVFINQPSLTLYGTCIPTNYYESLCERVARNGLLARMIVVESPDRGEWQEVSPTPIPPRVLEAADYWKKLTGDGNLWDQHPTPSELPFTEAARRLRAESNRNLDRRWDEAKQAGDAVRTTVLARVGAIGTTLAMLYAVSENHADPKITEQAVTWGYEIATRQADRMLHQFGMHAFSNEFEQLLKRILRKLSEAPKKTLPHSKLLKASRVDARTLENVIKTLILRQEIALVQETTKGRSAAAYKLL